MEISQGFSRRRFLTYTAATVGVTALAGCTPKVVEKVVKETVVVKETQIVEKVVTPVAPTVAAPTGPVKVKIMQQRNNITPEQEAQFNEDYAPLELEFVNSDQLRLMAMWAAGNPPDLFGAQAATITNYCINGMVMELDPFVETSSVIRKDDLVPAHKLMRWGGVGAGGGDLYGIIQDWSPEFSLWAYTDAFDDAGIPVPPEDKPTTYAGLFEMARKLNKKEGDRTIRWGFGSQAMTWFWTLTVMECLDQVGEKLYDPEFSRMILVDNPKAVEVVKYWHDLAKEDSTPNPINPTLTWDGDEFTKGRLGFLQYGYWFTPQAESDVTRGKVVFLPAPLWGGTVRRNPAAAASSQVMSSKTKTPDAAWTLMEWYLGKEPSVVRAETGHGVPALKSQYPLMPNDTPFQQQVQRVLAPDLGSEGEKFIQQYNPFYDSQRVCQEAWGVNLELVLLGQMTFEEMLQNIETTNNEALMEGIERAAASK